jgi:glycosyltransferase involved in cell wall biosynthesis
MRVHVVDPSAYTPPYDHALCQALGQQGLDVELFTSRFAYGSVAQADGYVRREFFYRSALGAPGSRVRRAAKLAEHVPDMLRYRRAAQAADIVHFQWLSVQHVDRYLLPHRRTSPDHSQPKLVLTAHDVLPREPRAGQLTAQRRLYERFDAIVVHSAHGHARLIGELGVDPTKVHVIPHGVFTHLADEPATEPPYETDAPVVLFFGLLRPYKGLDVLLDAWRGIHGAELWVAGMPRMDIGQLRPGAPPGVRFDARFIPDRELAAYFQRADLVVLPYLEADQSGVLFTALAFGKPLLLSDVGGFPEVARAGAARTVPAGDAVALHVALRDLLADPDALAGLADGAKSIAAGEYSWGQVARRTAMLYESVTQDGPP